MRNLVLVLLMAAALAGCGGDVEPQAADPNVEPSRIDPAVRESDSFSGGKLPADQEGLTLQKNHPNGSQLIVSAIRFGDTQTTVDLTFINGGKDVNRLNWNGQNMHLLDNLGNVYYVVPPPDNKHIEARGGEQIRGSFNFAGRMNPEATSVKLITSSKGGGSEDNQFTNMPKFVIDIPLEAR